MNLSDYIYQYIQGHSTRTHTVASLATYFVKSKQTIERAIEANDSLMIQSDNDIVSIFKDTE